MIVIGIDPHKSTHTATALDPASHTELGSLRIDATTDGYTRLSNWAAQWPQHTWAVENASGLGRHLSQWLLAQHAVVVDVPATATARVRELSGSRRKNDRLDAAAAAGIAAAQGHSHPVDPEGPTTVLALLDEHRTNLTGRRTRIVNQLHALLRDLLPGGAPSRNALTAATASRILEQVRACSNVERIRVGLSRELIEEITRLDGALTRNEKQMALMLDEHGTRLREVAGIGHIIAATLVGRTGRPDRFPSAAAFASYCGTAPVQVASADFEVHRVSREGDRQLNCAIHMIATTQIRMPGSAGRSFYDRYLAAHPPASSGRTAGVRARRAAKRALKRHIAGYVWKLMLADHNRRCSKSGRESSAVA